MKQSTKASNDRTAVFTTHRIGRQGANTIVPIMKVTGDESLAARKALEGLIDHTDNYDTTYAQLVPQIVDAETANEFKSWKNGELMKLRTMANEALAIPTKEAATFEANRRHLLAVPGLAPSDAAGAIRDQERRARFAAMPEEQQKRELAKVKAGQNEELLLSLARDVVETPHSQFALGIWQERKSREHAVALDGMARGEEAARKMATNIRTLVDTFEQS